VRIALIGPAHPDQGGGARHTTELARRLAAVGHNVIIESWRTPGPQLQEGKPYPRTYRRLARHRPDSWIAVGRRLRSDVEDLARALNEIAVPATARWLRAGVRPVDPEPYWSAYLRAVLAR
jgi:glycosyltransferase involved in cell wall biosynthesis